MTEDPVLSEEREGVAVLTLNRPRQRNAWTREMEVCYYDALEWAARRDSVRAIVVQGAGPSFSAGADQTELLRFASGQPVPPRDRQLTFPLSVPKPVIAAVHGYCVGIGFVHALMCDVRIVDESTRFRSAFAQLGLVAEHGSSWMLSRLIGHGAALDILLSGRVVTGPEASQLGLAMMLGEGKVADVAFEYASRLAANGSPFSMAMIKQQVYADLSRRMEDAILDAEARRDMSLRHADFGSAIARMHRADEPPKFAPLSAWQETGATEHGTFQIRGE